MIARIAPFIVLVFFVPLLTSAATFCPNLTQDMWYGSCDQNIDDPDCLRHVQGDQVSQLQHFLKDYFNNPTGLWMSGYFGNKTKSYVIQFQNDYDVPATGRVGPLTRAAIRNACSQTTTTPPPTNNLSCQTPWGTTIQSGSYVTAYQSSTVPAGQQCVSEQRTCTNGTLSGSYQYQTCSVLPPPQNNNTGAPTIAATNTDDPHPGDTVIITGTNFTSSNDILLDHEVRQSNVASTQNGTTLNFLVPANYPTGASDHALRVRNANGTSNARYIRVRPPTNNTTPPTVSLLINGQASITLAPNTPFTLAWSSSNATACNLTNAQGQTNPTTPNVSASVDGGAPPAGTTYTYKLSCTNSGGATEKVASVTGATSGGGGTGTLTATPSSGPAPLAVTFNGRYPRSSPISPSDFDVTVNFGDGTNPFSPLVTCTPQECSFTTAPPHTYGSSGTFNARLLSSSGAVLGTATITVGSGTTAANIGACTYKGQSYAEGQTISVQIIPIGTHLYPLICDNAAWVFQTDFQKGQDVCQYRSSYGYTTEWTTNLGCGSQMPSRPFLAVVPRHGKAPLTVSIDRRFPGDELLCNYSISWGDGTTDSESALCSIPVYTHTYASQGSFTIQYKYTPYAPDSPTSNSANIRVDPAGTASTQNQSQLANALSALESALKAILQLLGQ